MSSLAKASDLADSLLNLVRQRDPATAEHMEAVGNLSRRLALQLGHRSEVVATVEIAGRLHDVGKIAVPLSILMKPTSLTAEEWVEMRQHPEYGSSMLKCFPPLLPFAEIVRMHHERIDGTGYPDRVIGSAIPIEARIISVTDAFHAITVSRPYLRAQSPSLAMTELMKNAGTQFDADCVEAFISMLGGRLGSYRSTLSFDLVDAEDHRSTA
jgi:HD-GYP domain-containing protein (c-di-GMP phosphodiesterase class II)